METVKTEEHQQHFTGLGLKKTFCIEKLFERRLHHSGWLPCIPAIPRQHIPGIGCNKPPHAPMIYSRTGIVKKTGNESLGTRRYRHFKIKSRRKRKAWGKGRKGKGEAMRNL